MTHLAVPLLAVPLADHALKWMVFRTLGPRSLSLGALGEVQMRPAPIWLLRVDARIGPSALWGMWLAGAVGLLLAGVVLPAPEWSIGLLLGGSLSHVLETWRDGSVSDYVVLRRCAAFDLADVALVIGAGGTLTALAVVMLATLSP
jgi:hypothetical protein